MHYPDLSNCNYFGDKCVDILVAVGWLTNTSPFEVGPTPEHIFTKLKALVIDHWQPMSIMGMHHCELCQFDSPGGAANLFIPAGTSIFVCPELITHYIAAHHYRPPDVFLHAVRTCPDMHSMDYKKLLLASGGRKLVSRTGYSE